jgi:hypothetical protein
MSSEPDACLAWPGLVRMMIAQVAGVLVTRSKYIVTQVHQR